MADAELEVLLERFALSHHLDAFLDEELSIPLLRTMGDAALVSNLQELGLTHVEADAMRRALNAPLEPTADAVELAVRWQGSTLVYRHGRDATVADLRSWLEARERSRRRARGGRRARQRRHHGRGARRMPLRRVPRVPHEGSGGRDVGERRRGAPLRALRLPVVGARVCGPRHGVAG